MTQVESEMSNVDSDPNALVSNKLGFHARPADAFVRAATQFQSDIFVHKDAHKVSGKSIISLLFLAAGHGTTLTVHAHGHDALQAIEALGSLMETYADENDAHTLLGAPLPRLTMSAL